LRKAGEKLIAEGVSAYSTFANLDWWGGAGSIADVYLHRLAQPESEEQKNDIRMFRSALIDIYDAMKANGVRMARADRWADVFRKWQQMGI